MEIDICVPAKDVVVGDQLWKTTPSDGFRWQTIHTIRRNGPYVVMETIYLDTWKRPQEGVTVRRRVRDGE